MSRGPNLAVRFLTTGLSLWLAGLLLAGVSTPTQSDASDSTVVNLHPDGPQPQTVRVAPGTFVLWISHLAPTKLVIATVAFPEGQRVAQATTAVEGYNSFVLEGEHFVGRMEGGGGKVALRFIAPGEYAYTLDHHGHLSGTIVVQK
jgi:plastocyanin